MRKDIAITGLGAVTAAGIGAETLWHAARDGRSGIAQNPFDWEAGNLVKQTAKVSHFKAEERFSRSELAVYDPFTAFAVVAADEAIAQSGLGADQLAGPRTACIIGTGLGGATTMDANLHKLYALKEKRVDVFSVPRVMPNAAASHIGMRHHILGPSFAVSSACSSSTQAIGLGLQMIRAGMVDRAIVGGSEAMLSAGVMKAWEAMRVLTPDFIRPFSQGRNGMVLGEGAAVLVLEKSHDVAARGGKAMAYLMGYGTSSDAKDLLRPDPEGAASAMRQALSDADVLAEDIRYINAHGTGTALNDSNEVRAARLVFGRHADHLPMSSTKPIHGHVLGGGGAIEAIITLCAAQNGFLPPTLNYLEADPDCDMDCVPNTGRAADLPYVMSNSLAFGGINASLVFGRG
jgi:nodulation protein E